MKINKEHLGDYQKEKLELIFNYVYDVEANQKLELLYDRISSKKKLVQLPVDLYESGSIKDVEREIDNLEIEIKEVDLQINQIQEHL